MFCRTSVGAASVISAEEVAKQYFEIEGTSSRNVLTYFAGHSSRASPNLKSLNALIVMVLFSSWISFICHVVASKVTVGYFLLTMNSDTCESRSLIAEAAEYATKLNIAGDMKQNNISTKKIVVRVLDILVISAPRLRQNASTGMQDNTIAPKDISPSQ